MVQTPQPQFKETEAEVAAVSSTRACGFQRPNSNHVPQQLRVALLSDPANLDLDFRPPSVAGNLARSHYLQEVLLHATGIPWASEMLHRLLGHISGKSG
jgi:hypothetical protein